MFGMRSIHLKLTQIKRNKITTQKQEKEVEAITQKDINTARI